ncbi:MAG: bifunctional folylpolyglutamate synthase/dihydrofolate synthase [Bacilli bacterium]|nr:bifunctional folylpolyglutamate synthase/dihydrofolate synthase [Bacilli bacterium]
MEILNYLPYLKERSDYQRDNFEKFLKKVSFSYNIPSIHIAGTNGKGSTATYLARIYQEAGYKVGLFTSPYFYEMNEMIEINGEHIKDNEVTHYIDEYHKQIEKYHLSEFELETFIALSYFQDQKVDIAIIECGMGGMIDATNIFIPILSIITTISLEHTAFLGNSIYEVAYQKAGIIKEEVPVLIGELNEEAENCISDYALEMDAKVTKVAEYFNVKQVPSGVTFNYRYLENVFLPSYARYAVNDASIAIEAIYLLNDTFKVKDEIIIKGLANAKMINRMEVVKENPTIVIDGGHNPEAIKELEKAMSEKYGDKNIHILFACFKDKNISSMLPTLSLLTSDIILTTFSHPRARKEEDYFLFGEDYKFNPDYLLALNELISTYPDDVILVTGSLAFAAVVKKAIVK